MKNSKFAVFILCCLLLAACQKEETDTFDIPEGALALTTESFSSQSSDSKTSVQGTAVHWVNGDRIRINGTPGYVYTGTGADADKAYATGDWNLSTGVHAFYPADIVDQQYWNSDNPQVNFPNRFASSFDGGRQIIGLPMVGRAPANASGVKFLHLSAAINVRVRNNTGRAKLYIDSVTVSSASQQLCGIANVTFGSGGIYSIIGTGLTANNMSVTVYFPNPELDYLANGEIRDVQVPIYPTVAGELTFKVYCHTRADEEIHAGLCPAHIEYNYRRTLPNDILNRNVMGTAQLAVTNDGYTTRIDHGLFTASNGRQVRFSQGNLLCHRGNPWYTVDWFSFQAHQYIAHPEHHVALFGNGQNVGINYENDASNDWNIGLFGWGTSGYQHSWGWSYSPSSTENGDGYHEAYFKTKRNLFEPDYGNPAVADWGYAAITNGGNAENAGWFTPSKEDWQAIVFTRPASTVALHDFWGNAEGTCANARFVRAQVENSSRQPVKGLILFPDNFVDPFGPDKNHAMQYVNNTTEHTNWNENNVYYSNEDWFRMEAAGAVFLPAASWRCGRKVDGWVFVSNNGAQVIEHEGEGGYPYTYSEGLCQSFYWSSSVNVSYDAYGLAFAEGHPVEIIPSWRYIGHPVRLVFADGGHGQWGASGFEGYSDQGNAW